MIRVRHYTRVGAMKKIMSDLKIVARDQNKVFVESANARRLSPADAERKYGLDPGCANAYVEFDIEADLVRYIWNVRQKCLEGVIEGDVDLATRNPVDRYNR